MEMSMEMSDVVQEHSAIDKRRCLGKKSERTTTAPPSSSACWLPQKRGSFGGVPIYRRVVSLFIPKTNAL